MWIAKKAWDALQLAHQEERTKLQAAVVAHRQELATIRTQVVMLERALATAQGNVDWLRVFANTMSQDRQFIASTKGLELPGPQFDGQLQSAADIAAAARARTSAEGGGPPLEVGRAIETAPDVDSALAAYTGAVNGFEDVGDEEADRLGIKHNEQDGAVEYVKA